MSVAKIIQKRLNNQWLASSPAQTSAEVVSRLLAVQAQDYLGSLWGIGQRLPMSTQTTVEASIANGSIIRTWPMRGTLHFVSQEDARWLISFLAPRVLSKTKSIYRNAGLDEHVFKKSIRVVMKALEKHPALTRDELYKHLEQAKISTSESRGLHITGYLAIQGLICFGPRQGKQHTFVSMERWLRPATSLPADEHLPTLALRYFRGHGPATVHDLAWWAGITLTEARQAIAAAGSSLTSHKVKDEEYFTDTSNQIPPAKGTALNLLPAFDEFTVAYKDRSLMLAADQHHRHSMEVLSPVVSVNGRLIGTWTRTLSRNGLVIQLNPFSKLPQTQLTKIKELAKRYAQFLDVSTAPEIVLHK